MIGGDTDVSRAAFDHGQHRPKHAAGRSDLLAMGILRTRHGKKISEQLVGPVDEVHLHAGESPISGSMIVICRTSGRRVLVEIKKGALTRPHSIEIETMLLLTAVDRLRSGERSQRVLVGIAVGVVN